MVGQFILTEAQNQSDLCNLLSNSGSRTSGARRFVGKPINEMTSAHPGSVSRWMWASHWGNATRDPTRSYTFALTPKSKS